MGTTLATGTGVTTLVCAFGTSIGFGASTGGGLGCVRMNSTMRCDSSGWSGWITGGWGSNGIAMAEGDEQADGRAGDPSEQPLLGLGRRPRQPERTVIDGDGAHRLVPQAPE